MKEDEEWIELVVKNDTDIEFGLSLTFVTTNEKMLKHRNFVPFGALTPVKTLVVPKGTTLKQLHHKESVLNIIKKDHLYLVGNIVPREDLEDKRNASTAPKPKPIPISEPKPNPEPKRALKLRTSFPRSLKAESSVSIDAILRLKLVNEAFIEVEHDESTPYTNLRPIPFAVLKNNPKNIWERLKFPYVDTNKNYWLLEFKVPNHVINVDVLPCSRKNLEPLDFVADVALLTSRKPILSVERSKKVSILYQDKIRFSTAETPVTLELCTTDHVSEEILKINKCVSIYFAIGIHPPSKSDLGYFGSLPSNIRRMILEYLLEEGDCNSLEISRTSSRGDDVQRADPLETNVLILDLLNERGMHNNNEDGFSIVATGLNNVDES